VDVTPISGKRFGLTADTHDVKVDWPTIVSDLKGAWGRVDAILHCGDLTSLVALQSLAAIAPTYATRSDGDPPVCLPTLVNGPRVLEIEGLRIGLTFVLPADAMTGSASAEFFGGPVAVCVYGGTHESRVEEVDGVLFVNPGSPSLAKKRTAAVLSFSDKRVSAEIVSIRFMAPLRVTLAHQTG
jgi:putative phosphoesterase